jgi:hypothetical protein
MIVVPRQSKPNESTRDWRQKLKEMKPLNKFRLITHAHFFTLIKGEGAANLTSAAIAEFLNPASIIPLDYSKFMPIGGLN